MQPTRRTQPHRRKGGRVMENGQTLAAMLRGAGNLGNPQDVKRATVKRARVAMPANGADSDPQLGPAGLPPHSGASGMLGPMLAAVPVTRNVPDGTGVNPESSNLYPDADPAKRPRRARRAPFRTKRNEYRLHRSDGVFRGKRNPYRTA